MYLRCFSGYGVKFGIFRFNLSGGKILIVDNKEGRFRFKVLWSYVVVVVWMVGSCIDDFFCIFVGLIEIVEKV